MNKKERFLELVNKGLHYDELAKEFSVSERTIKAWADKYEVKVKLKSNRRVFFDLDYFENIDTEEKAYILGFVTADGYIDMKNKGLHITLANKDLIMLEMIAKELGFTGKIREEVRNRSTISLCSKKMVKDLSVYGVIQNKTKETFIPDIPEHLKRHYLRGFFDGDGYVGEKQATLVVGSKQFEKDLLEYVEKYKLGTPYVGKTTENSNRIVFSRKDIKFLIHIYGDSNIGLPRKQEAYEVHWSSYWKQKEV